MVPCHVHSLRLGSHRIIVLSNHMVDLELLSAKPINITRISIQTDCYQMGFFEPVNADFGPWSCTFPRFLGSADLPAFAVVWFGIAHLAR